MSRKSLFFLIFAFVAVSSFAGKQKDDTAMDARKAEYLYYEAMNKLNEEDEASFYDLINRAYELDTANVTIGYYYGYSQLFNKKKTAKQVNRALGLMRRYVDKYPASLYENHVYSSICSQFGNSFEAIRVWKSLLEQYPNRVMLYDYLSDSYARVGAYGEAVACLDSLEVTEGRSEDVTVNKLGYMMAENDTVAVIAEGRKVLKETNNGFFGNILMADIFHQLGQPDSALIYYDFAQKLEPSNGYVNLSRANVYRSMGDNKMYEEEMQKALVNKEIDVKTKEGILTSYIRKSIEDNDSTLAITEVFNKVIEQHPHEASLRTLFADYLSFRKDYAAAAEQLGFALDINPTEIKDWKRLMWMYIYIDEFDKAIATGDKCLTFIPNYSEIYYIQSVAFFNLKDYQKSIELIQIALEKDKDQGYLTLADVYTSLAECYNRVGDLPKAFENYEYAILLVPDNALTLNNYAYTLVCNGGDLARAEEMSLKALEKDPENDSYLDTYAWICFKKADYKTALEYILKAIEFTEGDLSAELYEHYGDILFMNGDPKKALEQWKKAYEQNPDSELLKRKVMNKTYFYE